jgi:tetratricopeptide (TPR) repeat protein
LDDNLLVDESRPNGILLENGSIEIETAPNVKKVLWRYKFVSDWHWQILNRYAFPTVEEKFKYAGEMIQALKIVFETNERFAAKSLAKLYKTVKDDDSARNYQQIADYAMSFEKTRELALALLQVDTTDWDQFRCQQLGVFLYKAGEKIHGANPHEDLAVFEKAEELVSRAFDSETKAHCLFEIAWIQADFGEFRTAEKKASLCLKLYEKFNKKLYKGKTCALLGHIYFAEDRYAEAEPVCKIAFEIYESVLGANHPLTAMICDNLGLLYQTQGKYELAEKYNLKALKIFEKVLGENHSDTATTYNNLALLYQMQEKYELAEKYHLKALKFSEKVLGENHPLTAKTYDNLAVLYETQGKYGLAEKYNLKALKIFEKVLGENHPDTLIGRQNLEILNEKLADSK